jgi:hypothetical protein
VLAMAKLRAGPHPSMEGRGTRRRRGGDKGARAAAS